MKKIFILLFMVLTLTGCSTDLNKDKNVDKNVEVQNTASSIYLDDETPETYYKVLGKSFFMYDQPQSIVYGDLDELKRPTYATAYITPEIYIKEKNEKRAEIKVNPTGWPSKNIKVQLDYKDGTHYKGYMFNRSHMIADSLGGEPILENLITGTRPQNVGTRSNNGGMAYAETKVRNHFDKGNTSPVWYEVVNFYKDDELIPRRTLINMKSTDGSIDERVVVYNTADNYEINYYNAEVQLNKKRA